MTACKSDVVPQLGTVRVENLPNVDYTDLHAQVATSSFACQSYGSSAYAWSYLSGTVCGTDVFQVNGVTVSIMVYGCGKCVWISLAFLCVFRCCFCV
jgi:hypothetical protein